MRRHSRARSGPGYGGAKSAGHRGAPGVGRVAEAWQRRGRPEVDRAATFSTDYSSTFYLLSECYTTHMLSLFPDLLVLGIVAPFFLRLSVGVFFLFQGYHLFTDTPSKATSTESESTAAHAPTWQRVFLALITTLGGSLLVIGLFTQGAALLLALLSYFLWRTHDNRPQLAPHEPLVYVFAGIMCLSLLLLGPGILGFDYPL